MSLLLRIVIRMINCMCLTKISLLRNVETETGFKVSIES